MSKRVIIVHGFGGYPEKNWFPWLKAELEKQGITTIVPAMPNSAKPELKPWLATLKEAVGDLDDSTALVGHSIGGTTVMRFLESTNSGQHARGVVLVAAAAQPLPVEELKVLDHFFEQPFGFAKIKDGANRVIAIYSTNDHRVPIISGHIVKKELADDYIEIPEGGHLNERSGYNQFPLVLEKILRLYDMSS